MKHESATETYLRRATRGLWGRKRREVKEELEAHLSERVLVHQIAGLAEADAVERALSELGRPQEVSVGMARLYTLPTVVGSGAALAAACVAVAALLSSSVAQPLSASFFWPSPECAASEQATEGASLRDCFIYDGSLWLDARALEQTLKPQGVKVRNSADWLTLRFPNGPTVQTFKSTGGIYVEDEDGTSSPLAVEPNYFSLWDLLEGVGAQSGLDITVSGWNNPTIRIADASFQVGTAAQPVTGNEFYLSYLQAVVFTEFITPLSLSYIDIVTPRLERRHNPDFDASAVRRASLTLEGGASGVYGLFTVVDENGPLAHKVPPGEARWDIALLTDLIRPAPDGTLNIDVPTASRLRFVEEPSIDPKPGETVLIALPGRAAPEGWYEVVSPENITLEPTP